MIYNKKSKISVFGAQWNKGGNQKENKLESK